MDRSLLDLGGAVALHQPVHALRRHPARTAAELHGGRRAGDGRAPVRPVLRTRWPIAACRSRRGGSGRGCRWRSRTRVPSRCCWRPEPTAVKDRGSSRNWRCEAAILGRSLPPGDLRLRPHSEWASAHFFCDMTRIKRHPRSRPRRPRPPLADASLAGPHRGAPGDRRARGRGAGRGACGLPPLAEAVRLPRPARRRRPRPLRAGHAPSARPARRLHRRGLLAGAGAAADASSTTTGAISGSRVRVRTREAIEGRSDFKGELVGADDGGRRAGRGLGDGPHSARAHPALQPDLAARSASRRTS